MGRWGDKLLDKIIDIGRIDFFKKRCYYICQVFLLICFGNLHVN